MILRKIRSAAFGLALAASMLALPPARAADAPYSVSTDGTSQKVQKGKQGTLVIRFHTAKEAHISNEAPLKITLSGEKLTPAKQLLRYQDSVAKKQADKEFPDPRFEVPFTATDAGKGQLTAKLTFFVCTANLCERHQQTLQVPVEVD